MEQLFYINTLFGRNQQKIFEFLHTIIRINESKNKFRFQINPFRISPLAELSEKSDRLRNNIVQHYNILEEIKSSGITKKKPFSNVVFVNYTTKELEPALKYDRVRFYLCDYISDENIELLTLTNLTIINFMRGKKTKISPSLNSVFISYSSLTFYDTDADRRVGNATSLDMGERTEDDVTYLIQTRLYDTHITDGDVRNKIILPYHPFRHSFFMSVQNTKDNINAILLAANKHLLYFPFEQEEWLVILRNIMYEHVFLNYLISPNLYENEYTKVHSSLYRNSVSSNYKFFEQVQRKHKIHILNELVFDYSDVFVNNTRIYTDWYNTETRIDNKQQSFFSLDVVCLSASNGLFI